MSDPVFELVGLTEDEDSPVLLGLWSAAASPPVSFEAGETAPEIPVWRVNIPDDEQLAEQWFDQGEERLRQARAKLAQVAPRLDHLAQLNVDVGATSFTLDTIPLPPAEQHLLDEVRGWEDGTGAVAFGFGDDVMASLRKLQEAVRYYAAAETAHQGVVLGRTTLSWLGDADTVWASLSTRRQVNMHRRTVNLVVASKDATIRLLFLTLQSAAKIAASLSTGGITAAAAIPIAWRYIRDVLAELDKLEAVKQA